MIPSYPGEELDDLIMSTLFVLLRLSPRDRKVSFFVCQEMALLHQSIGGGLDSQGCYIHRGRPGFSGVLSGVGTVW